MQVTIRPLQEQDAYTSVKWRNDSEVFKYTGNIYKNEIKLETELEWIRKVITNHNNGTEYRCAILADDVYVGNIFLTHIENGTGIYNIFIGNKDYWGKGVAKQASMLILDYAFNTLHLSCVELKVKRANTRAYNLYKKLGFKEVCEDETWITMEVSPNNY